MPASAAGPWPERANLADPDRAEPSCSRRSHPIFPVERAEPALGLLDAGQARFEVLRQRFGELIRGHADRLVGIAQRVLGDHAVLGLAQYEADAGAILGGLDLLVDRGEVEA